MKIIIHILNYVDTIDLLIDGRKIDIKKLSFFSKAEFEHNLESGVHEIIAIKKSQILEKNWRKNVVYDWLSAVCSVPDFTLKEALQDTKIHSIKLFVKIEEDTSISLKLSPQGFDLVEKSEKVLNEKKETITSTTAKKRIKNAYILPSIILAAAIEFGILTVGVLLLANSYYTRAIVIFALAAFWVWLILSMFFKRIK